MWRGVARRDRLAEEVEAVLGGGRGRDVAVGVEGPAGAAAGRGAVRGLPVVAVVEGVDEVRVRGAGSEALVCRVELVLLVGPVRRGRGRPVEGKDALVAGPVGVRVLDEVVVQVQHALGPEVARVRDRPVFSRQGRVVWAAAVQQRLEVAVRAVGRFDAFDGESHARVETKCKVMVPGPDRGSSLFPVDDGLGVW